MFTKTTAGFTYPCILRYTKPIHEKKLFMDSDRSFYSNGDISHNLHFSESKKNNEGTHYEMVSPSSYNYSTPLFSKFVWRNLIFTQLKIKTVSHMVLLLRLGEVFELYSYGLLLKPEMYIKASSRLFGV